jgi:hypothetical protein
MSAVSDQLVTEAAELYRTGSMRFRQDGWELFMNIVADTLKDHNLQPTMSMREARKIVEMVVATVDEPTECLEDFIEGFKFAAQKTHMAAQTPLTAAQLGTAHGVEANIRTHYKQLNPAEYARQRKVLRGDVEEAWKEMNHFKLLRKIDRYIDWPALEFHEALQACGHEAALPNKDATPTQYLQRLATTDDLYMEHMVEPQATRYRNGKAMEDPRMARLMLALIRQLADFTHPQHDDPERISKMTLAQRMGLGTFWNYGTFFVSTDRIWASTQRAFAEVNNREEFDSACRTAEDAAQSLWASQCHRKQATTATAHHINTPPAPLQTRDTTRGNAGYQAIERLAQMRGEERRALRERILPLAKPGHCTFCRKRGHSEDVCYISKEVRAALASAYPN